MTNIDRHILQQQGKTLFQAKSYVKLTSKQSSVRSTTYLLCLMNVCYNRQSTLQMVPAVPLFICMSSIICMKKLLKGNENRQSGPLISRFCIQIIAFPRYCQDDYVDPFYQVEPDIKDTTGAARSASYLYLHHEIDSERRFRT